MAKKIPQRMCVGCREMQERQLIVLYALQRGGCGIGQNR